MGLHGFGLQLDLVEASAAGAVAVDLGLGGEAAYKLAICSWGDGLKVRWAGLRL